MPQKLLKYEVLERLGEGAKSTIYAVSDPETHQVYALKHVVRAQPKDLRFIEQMEAEYEVSRQFTHPNLRRSFELKIVKTLMVKISEAYLVMELVDGRPLDERPPASFLETIDTFVKAAEGLRAMHQLGYAHCDIKPNNILRGEHGEVKVIDFGQSCKIGTIKERIQGTPDYIAPEQVNRLPISVQTDVFNLGATLYWAVTGKNIPTLYTVNKKGENSFLVDERMPSPVDLNPKVPPQLSALIMEMVATSQRKRPADMDAVISRLELIRHVLQRQNAPPGSFAVPSGPDPADSTAGGAVSSEGPDGPTSVGPTPAGNPQ
ncbi:MAG TPA: protein kinase [Tepidisphaeraceae bacterium]|nr:protein kinase [Tepidisphaeraceae bacterium]